MSPETIGLLGLLVLVILILIRVPIGVSLIAVSFVGTGLIVGERVAWGMLGVIPYSLASDWSLSSVPMFILMGYIAYHGRLTSGLFAAARVWLNNVPGGLAISAIFGSTGFAAVTGSSVACSASMGRIAVPEMERAGYDLGLATGCVAAAGTIGALIPPSILLIIYGVIANVSITDLFVAGIVPGLLTGAGYIAIVVGIALVRPHKAPRHPRQFTWQERLTSLRAVLPTLIIILCVFGGLFAGVFTPGQAGAVGSAFALLLCLLRRSIGRHEIWSAFRETLEVTTSLFIIVIGANLLTRFLAFSGAGDLLSETIASAITDRYMLLLAIACVYLLLGMFLDPLGAMLLTLPIFLPLLDGAGISALWFGVFLVKLLEVGMITPPIGLNVFVMQGVVGDRVKVATIFRGVIPFILSDIVIVMLMVAVPGLVLALPALLNQAALPGVPNAS